MNISYIKNTKSTSSINNPTKSVGEAKLEPKNEDKNTVNSKKTSANDKCDISNEAKAFIKMQNDLLEEKNALLELICNKNKKEENEYDSMTKTQKILLQCIKIAAQIKKGNKVSIKDLQFLLKHDHQLYMLAMVSKQPNDNPKRVSRISKEEKEDNNITISQATANENCSNENIVETENV